MVERSMWGRFAGTSKRDNGIRRGEERTDLDAEIDTTATVYRFPVPVPFICLPVESISSCLSMSRPRSRPPGFITHRSSRTCHHGLSVPLPFPLLALSEHGFVTTRLHLDSCLSQTRCSTITLSDHRLIPLTRLSYPRYGHSTPRSVPLCPSPCFQLGGELHSTTDSPIPSYPALFARLLPLFRGFVPEHKMTKSGVK